MKSVTHLSAVRPLAALIVMTAPVWAAGQYDMRVDHGLVKRGSSEFTIRSIYVPDLAKPGTSLADATQDMNRIADVGAQVPCFDLYGLSESGRDLAQDAIDAMRQIREIGYDRSMLGMVRVFGPYAPTDPKARLRAARTVARRLGDERQFVYLLEGPDAGKLAREIKRHAPGLLLASPEGGDIQVVLKPATKSDKPTLLLGALPPSLDEQAHFVMPQYDESYQLLDLASALPIEAHSWTPNNSSLTPQEKADGWIAIFDGKTFNGWTILGGNQQAWTITNGVLERVESGSNGLRTIDRYGNFVLRWEWSLPKGGNNGVHISAPRAARESRVGMEYQMLGDYGKPPDKNSTGSVYDVVPPTVNAVKPDGEWNSSEITFNSPHLKYVLNGVTVQDLNMNDNDALKVRLRHGFIVLTEHNDTVMYRNIRLKPLPTPNEQMAIPAQW